MLRAARVDGKVADPKARAQTSALEARLSEKDLELTKMRARITELEGQLEETKAHRKLGEACPIPNGAYVHGERLTDGDFNRKNVRAASMPRHCSPLSRAAKPALSPLKPSPS